MRCVDKLLPIFILFIITLIFFRKTFINGLVPFPGDLLVSEYQPFRSYSYLGFPPGGVPNKAQYFDTIREFYPWRTLVNNQFKSGQWPLWNPYNFSGSPLLANYLTAVFYPLNLLYLLLNQVSAWAILIMLQPLLASLFIYLYTRKIGISSYGSILSAICFAYCSYMNVWLEFNTVGHTILWLPLILYSIEKVLDKEKFTPWCLLLIFSLTSSLFAGFPIDFVAVLIFSIFYSGFRLVSVRKNHQSRLKLAIVTLLPCYLATLLIGSIQLLPTINLLKNSTRVPFSYYFFINKMLIQPYQLIMIFIPDFFGNPATRNFWLESSYVGLTLSIGLTPLLFVSYLLLNFKKFKGEKFQMIQIFLAIALVVLLLTINTPLTRLFYKLPIPFILTNSPTKLLSLFAFSLSILAGFGVDSYLKTKSAKRILKAVAPFILVFLLAWMSLKTLPLNKMTTSFRNTFYSTAILTISTIIFLLCPVLAQRKKNLRLKKIALFLLITVTVFDLHYAFQKFNPFSPKEFIFPRAEVLEFLKENAGINRFWGYGTAKIDSNIASQYQLFSPDGFDALNPIWYNSFISSSKDGKIKTNFTHLDRSIAEIHPGYGETDLPSNKYRLKVLDALGVKYILNRVENPKDENTFPAERFKLIWQDEAGWQVFENLKSAPRFFLTIDIKTYKTKEEFERMFFAEDFDPSNTILIEDSHSNNLAIEHFSNKPIGDAFVPLKSYEPNKVAFQINTPVDAFLFLSDTFDFGWKGYIDEKETKVYRTNYAFRSVFVPKGQHEVVFCYQPSIFKFVLKNTP